jgi:hypothetical protein
MPSVMTTHHMTVSTVGRLSLTRNEAERRVLLRAFVAVGRGRLIAFSLVDDHAHAVISAERPNLVARDLRRTIARVRPDLELDVPHLKWVDSRRYLTWLLSYLVSQPVKHGLAGHPALWTGSCFQDLVGARLLSGFSTALLREALPRFRARTLYRRVGLDQVDLRPACDQSLRRAGPARLAALATGVYGVGPEMLGRTQDLTAARALAALVAVKVGLSRAAVSRFLGISRQAAARLACRRMDPKAEHALRLRFDLEERASLRGRPAA